MKINHMGSCLAVAMLAVLLSSSLPVPARATGTGEWAQAVHQGQAVDGNAIVAPARTRFTPLALPGRTAGWTTVMSLVSESAERALPALPSGPSRAVKATSSLTSQGIPDWLYCFLHKRWCQS